MSSYCQKTFEILGPSPDPDLMLTLTSPLSNLNPYNPKYQIPLKVSKLHKSYLELRDDPELDNILCITHVR